MMDEQQTKFKTVLTNVLTQKLQLNDNEKTAIINHVKDEGNIGNTQMCINCMKVALQLWEHEGPTKEPLVFFMDFLAEFTKNKRNFVMLHQNNILKRFIHLFQSTDYTKDSDIFRRYIKLLDGFTHHEYGKNWLVDCWDSWKNVFKIIVTQQYTEDLSVLLTNLFLSVVDTNELFSLNLSRLILKPLTIVCIKISQNNLIGVLEEDLYSDIIPTLNLLSSVIMCICEKVTLDNQWLKHCSKLLEFQKPLTLLLEIVEGKELILELSKLLTGLYFLELAHNFNNYPAFTRLFFDNTVKMIDLNTSREFVDNTIILAYHLQHYWHHICKLFDIAKLHLPCDFNVFICMYQIAALFGTCKKILGIQLVNVMEEDVFRDHFVGGLIKKLGKSMWIHMTKIRKLVFGKHSFLPEIHLALDYICKCLDLYNKECKIILFNALIYFMGDIISDIHKNKCIKSEYYDCSIVTHFINTFIFFGGGCDITWKDVTTHMLALVTVTDLLQVQNLPSDVIVASLKMLDLAITKRMAPDLTLLVDCNSLNSIGSLLDSKLNCENVEVRSAASKVLVTVSESAKSNYPVFQKILLDSKLPQQLLMRIFNKEVMEVRSNAVKCLQHLVRIPSIWDVIFSFLNILDSIINLLKSETDNLLRAELINLVAIIYEEDYFNDLQVNELYDLMTRLGTHDPNITVRINCLKFWNVLIKKLLVEEGMIDGEFPEVTFSKESRKIVVLDENEIKRRLKRLMKKLSDNGCLTVLNYCFFTTVIEEKQCVDEIVYDLLVTLKNHHIDETNVDSSYSKSLKSTFKIFSQNDLVLEIVGPQEFLENVTQSPAWYCEDNSEINFIGVLDDVLKRNNLFL